MLLLFADFSIACQICYVPSGAAVHLNCARAYDFFPDRNTSEVLSAKSAEVM